MQERFEELIAASQQGGKVDGIELDMGTALSCLCLLYTLPDEDRPKYLNLPVWQMAILAHYFLPEVPDETYHY